MRVSAGYERRRPDGEPADHITVLEQALTQRPDPYRHGYPARPCEARRQVNSLDVSFRRLAPNPPDPSRVVSATGHRARGEELRDAEG
jgi:hypothetical protein